MSDTAKRDAVLEEFAHDAGVHCVWGVAGMADAILRLRDENAALKAAIKRVRALHVGEQAFYPNWDGAVICPTCNRLFPCPTLRALEGTP